MKWSAEELKKLETLSRRSRTVYQLWLDEFHRAGSPRSYNAVEHKVRALVRNRQLTLKSGEPSQKLAYLDVETTYSKADSGLMLTWALKGRDENRVQWGCVDKQDLFSYRFDKQLVADLLKAMVPYDVFVVYYGSRFDLPYLRTRAIDHGLPFFPYGAKRMYDLYYLARAKLYLHSNRLESVCNLLGVRGKTKLNVRLWRLAQYGHPESLRYIVKHNIADVRILERAHKRLERYARGVLKSL